MAQQWINGELVDDGQGDGQTSNPMAGLTSTSTPTKPSVGAPTPTWSDEDWGKLGSFNTGQGMRGSDWSGAQDILKKVSSDYNISPDQWQTTGANLPFAGNASWWGPQAAASNYMDAWNSSNPNRQIDTMKYVNPNSSGYNTEKFGTADRGMAEQRHGGDDFFGSLMPLLLMGGLGLATGGFGFGAGADALAGWGGGEAMAGGGALPDLGASALGGTAGASPFATGGADWMGEIAAGAGNGGATLGSYADGASLGDLFNPDASWGVNPQGDPGANTMFGNPGSSASNLEQMINTPTPEIPGANFTPDQVGPIDPATGSSTSQYGLDSQGANMKMGGTGLNNLYGTPGNAGSLNGLNPGAQSWLGNTPVNVSQAAMNPSGFKMNDIFKIMQSPEFQVAKTGYNVFSQNQKYNQLRDLFNQMKQSSDVGGPFRDKLMQSYNDPNFFNNMPEFKAGNEAFNQQYAATAAKNGQRSNLGGAAQQIAVNRENARLADIYRGRLAGVAGMQPNTSGMGVVGPAMINAQGNQFNSLLDPNLWKALQGMTA